MRWRARRPRALAGLAVLASLVATGCGAGGAPAGTWSNDDGATVTRDESGRVVFADVPLYVRSVSCTEPVQIVSGEGRDARDGLAIDVMLDDPIALDGPGGTRQVNIVFSATGPSWDAWREIGIGGCDTDDPVTRLKKRN